MPWVVEAFTMHFSPIRSPRNGPHHQRSWSAARCTVEEWTELQGLAAAAKDTVAHGGGVAGAGRKMFACTLPHTIYVSDEHVLRPRDKGGDQSTAMFQLTGHTVRRNEPANILHYTRNPPEIVTEVPGSLLKLAAASGAIRQKLLPTLTPRPARHFQRRGRKFGGSCKHVDFCSVAEALEARLQEQLRL
ncbi:hypothetical protein B0H13DRAFT_1884514 [Mycena leptocephala]|nr:hypothetical protein B0H13DRAFT_1884514 [Mycena leptocephala]